MPDSRRRYNANNDCNSCSDTCGARTDGGHSGTGCDVAAGGDPDMAGMGSSCNTRGTSNACLADGRLDGAHDSGCTITSQSMVGVVCCRDDYQELALTALPAVPLTVGGETRYYQVIIANQGISWYDASHYASKSHRTGQRGHLAVVESAAEQQALSVMVQAAGMYSLTWA